MADSLDKQSTPGPDDNPASLTTSKDKDLPLKSSIVTLDPYSPSTDSKGDKIPIDKLAHMRVLHCVGLSLLTNYESLFTVMKQFGIIERIRLRLSSGKGTFEAYVVYNNYSQAHKALLAVNNGNVSDISHHANLYSIDNFNESSYDFVPNLSHLYDDFEELVPKSLPEPIWHLAKYKTGQENLIKGSECLERKVGCIPKGNLKQYGRKLLVKAGNESQAILLKSFKPSPSDVILEVSPHPTFNNSRGVVYSHDLYEFSEEQILKRCPPSVIRVKKLKGVNNAILLTFSSTFPQI